MRKQVEETTAAAGAPRCRHWVLRLVQPSHNSLYALPTQTRPHPLRILTSRRPSTNLEHNMRAVNLPNPRSLHRFRQTRPA